MRILSYSEREPALRTRFRGECSKMPPKAVREPDTEVATAEASFCKVELESEVAGARPIETNDYSQMDTQPQY